MEPRIRSQTLVSGPARRRFSARSGPPQVTPPGLEKAEGAPVTSCEQARTILGNQRFELPGEG